MGGVLERPAEYGIYAQEDGEVDAHNDEREYLAAVVDEVEAVKVTVFEYSGDEERPGNQHGKESCDDLNPSRGANHQLVGKSNEHAEDDRHNEENPAEYEHWEYFVAEGAIACESFNVVREGAVCVINYEEEKVAQEDIAAMHDASPQDPWHGAWERIESPLTGRNNERYTLFTEPDIALLQHISLAVALKLCLFCHSFSAQPRPDGVCLLYCTVSCSCVLMTCHSTGLRTLFYPRAPIVLLSGV